MENNITTKNNTNKKNYIIRKIAFTKEFRCFEKNELIDFKPGLNLIVGDQGCGKSSLMYAIINWGESGISADYDETLLSGFSFMDTEKMNPRLEKSFQESNSLEDFKDIVEYDKEEFRSVVNRVTKYNCQSHGEVILPLILSSKNPEGGKTFFFDEPEAGLSIRSQHKIFKHLNKLAKNNQVFVATHSIVLMQKAKQILSLEHKRWIDSNEFIESQSK